MALIVGFHAGGAPGHPDLSMDFADALLVALCERIGIREIATIDGDFRVYRYRDRAAFRNLFFGR